MTGDHLTRAQLIGELNVSESTIRRWEGEGMPIIPVGTRSKRYNLREVKNWLKAQEKACQSGQTKKAESTLVSCFTGKEFTDAYRRAVLKAVPRK